MRKLTHLLLLLLMPMALWAQDFPERTDRLVNDFSNTLTRDEIADLNQLLEGYERESSIEIAIVLLPTLNGYEISQYTFDLGEKWGIGKSGTDNGALILVSVGDRKIWIATGYGLEGALPDGLVSRIIREQVLPRFKENDYHGGLRAASESVIQATRGEYQGQKRINPSKTTGLVILIVLLVWLIIWMTAVKKARKYARLNNVGFWAAWALLNSARTKHTGSWSSFSGGRGFSGGGFSGGGGGFGGFGGGSFGGGGAGGSW